MSGSLSRNASSPRRTTSWSSTTRTAMVSSRRGCISGAIRFRRDPDSYDCPRPRCARDREPPADLGRTAAHRLQAEVTGMSGGWVEARARCRGPRRRPALAEPRPERAPRSPRRASGHSRAPPAPIANSWVSTGSDSASRGPGPRTSMVSPSECALRRRAWRAPQPARRGPGRGATRR